MVFFSNRKTIRRFSDKMQLTIFSSASHVPCLKLPLGITNLVQLKKVKTSLK